MNEFDENSRSEVDAAGLTPVPAGTGAATTDPALTAAPTTTIAVAETGPVPGASELVAPAEGVIGPGSFLKQVEADGEKDLKALDDWFNRHFHPSMWAADIHERFVIAYNELKTLL